MKKKKKKNIYIYILCDICLMFSLKFGRKLIFFFLAARHREPHGTSFIWKKKKVKKEGKSWN